MDFDATMAQLDQILQADRQRKEVSLGLLRSVVGALDGSAPPLEDAGDGDEGRLPRRVTATSVPFVPIPKRKTRGGQFGPAVLAKLRSEALSRR